MNIKFKKSPNFGPRRHCQNNLDRQTNLDSHTPSMIVYHATYMDHCEQALERLCDPMTEVSCHYLISKEGCIWQLVDLEKRAWHAGKSCWREISDVNSASIGIELDYANPYQQKSNIVKDFANPQIEGLIELVDYLCDLFPIKHWGHVTHQDIAPERKTDPGPYFPWRKLSDHQFGLMPADIKPESFSKNKSKTCLNSTNIKHMKIKMETLLHKIGYDPKASFDSKFYAFQCHFFPQNIRQTHDVFDTQAPHKQTIIRDDDLVRSIEFGEQLLAKL
ncbi:MAG: N-acetylmuramoyl-L-alanine amidase [Pseudomonadota bacterium]